MQASLTHIPRPAARRIALRVTAMAQHALRVGHPWLFDRSILSTSKGGHTGDLAVIFDDHRRFLAIGLYDAGSPLRVRILQHGEPATIDSAWFAGRIAWAARIRRSLPGKGTTGYRVVHGENDGLPGLVIDRYDRTFVLKLYTLAWLPWLEQLVDAITSTLSPARLVLRLSRELLAKPDALFGLSDGAALIGDQPQVPVAFTENGLRFEADVVLGQKTGFFLDQRENRARVETLARGKSTLNVFAYSGGFSLYAARGGAPAVISLDASAPALAAAERNFELNGMVQAVANCRHTVVAGDAFEQMEEFARAKRRFDLVIVDPPAFAKREAEVEAARRAYGRLTRLALQVMIEGGILVMASCSSRVTAEQFYATVTRAAVAVDRPLREIARTGHALDHPIGFPEGAYLKCLFAIAP
jgi:23S rRNA (cytosine1962-C5)-methyltransferase